MRRARLAAVALCLVLAGCETALDGPDLDAEPPPRPSPEQVAEVVAGTREPSYWLGTRYERYALSEIRRAGPDGVGFSYGEFFCEPGSGCTAPAGVWTQPRDFRGLDDRDLYSHIDPADCWRRLGKAVVVLLGCDPRSFPQEIEILTGSRAVLLSSIDDLGDRPAMRVARDLKPLNDHAPWPFIAPDRLSCRELGRIGRRYRHDMPVVLRPRRDC